MSISAAGLDLIKSFEGLKLKAYRDPVGIWTIGYGHTRNVKAGQVISPSQAVELLKEDLKDAEADVDRLVKVQINPSQRAALVSFVFNLGGTNFAKSTLLRKLNAGDYAGAAEEFGRWVNAGGQRLPGLVRRREAEKKLFLSPAKSEPKTVSRSTLRRGDTGTAVLDLQRALGFVNSAVDGSFGPLTEHAVREFQAHHNLKVDGIVGKATNQLLFPSEADELMKFREDE